MSEQDTNENLDSTNETEDTDTVNEEEVADTSTEDSSNEELAKLKEQNKKLFERAKKAEGFVFKDGQWVKLEAKPQPKPQSNAQSDISDELRLIARGLSEEDIDQAKVIAKGRGVSLPEALKDPLFNSYKVGKEEQEKKDKAKLGASGGSDYQGEEPLVKPGMSKEEHLKVWKEKLGR